MPDRCWVGVPVAQGVVSTNPAKADRPVAWGYG
jgi:hypothetical protein